MLESPSVFAANLMEEAIQQQASDIHFTPENETSVFIYSDTWKTCSAQPIIDCELSQANCLLQICQQHGYRRNVINVFDILICYKPTVIGKHLVN